MNVANDNDIGRIITNTKKYQLCGGPKAASKKNYKVAFAVTHEAITLISQPNQVIESNFARYEEHGSWTTTTHFVTATNPQPSRNVCEFCNFQYSLLATRRLHSRNTICKACPPLFTCLHALVWTGLACPAKVPRLLQSSPPKNFG